ncbi:transcriptional regulator [Desulfoluna limicola]|uniref:Transcriptional regulator n=1 Tax=Desulfoluna limicola TaxID=2810562 RepID=A0ABN6EYI9_9BACT|nr:LytS/YhcK type 5TM receptor domain-containing protein [Desulfoluna limicola]BCS94558.1 transcriptional regulator [Desulfoluna limicola]
MDVSIAHLLITLIEHLGLTVAAAFLILNMGAAGKTFLGKHPWVEKAVLTVFFGLFAILGNYGFGPVHDAFANLRAMAVVTGGLFGGPWVGIGAGVIAGGHRFLIDIGGFTSAPCATATLIEGVAAGLLAGWYGSRVMNWKVAFGLGVAGESMHMGLVLLFAKPFPEAVDLVQLIAVPMILVNSVGAAFFVELIKGLFREREQRESRQVQQILGIANLTVGYLRSGLGAGSAKKTAEIIFRYVDVAAVAITDTTHVLAHMGEGADHHIVGEPIRTAATRMVLDDGLPLFRHTRREIACPQAICPFHHGIIVPLKKGDTIVGTLKFYGTRAKPLDRVHFQTVKGLAVLFSTQLELEDIQIKARMLAYAEIRRLQAQINPHFLFNSLNTIASFCRTRPDRARELILDLSNYMRRNLDQSKGYITVKEELEQVEAYLAIEQARFGKRVKYRLDVGEGCDNWPIPSLVIQPVVENAVKHGITPKEKGGTVTVSITCEEGLLKVRVTDDGMGMPEETVNRLYNPEELAAVSEGIGVRNTIHRLRRIYGPACRMVIQSVQGQGTEVTFSIPRNHPSAQL